MYMNRQIAAIVGREITNLVRTPDNMATKRKSLTFISLATTRFAISMAPNSNQTHRQLCFDIDVCTMLCVIMIVYLGLILVSKEFVI